MHQLLSIAIFGCIKKDNTPKANFRHFLSEISTALRTLEM